MKTIVNRRRLPIRVPLPGGKVLHLGPSKTGQIADQHADLPVFVAHGTDDPMIPLAGGERARDRLGALGHPVEFRTYPMEHSVAPEEIADLGTWLGERLAPAAGG